MGKIQVALKKAMEEKKDILECLSKDTISTNSVKERLKRQSDLVSDTSKKRKGEELVQAFVTRIKTDENNLHTLKRRLAKEANHEINSNVENYYSEKRFSKLKKYGVNAIVFLSLIVSYRL